MTGVVYRVSVLLPRVVSTMLEKHYQINSPLRLTPIPSQCGLVPRPSTRRLGYKATLKGELGCKCYTGAGQKALSVHVLHISILVRF